MWQGSPSPLVDLAMYLVHTHARLGCTSMGRLGFAVAVPPQPHGAASASSQSNVPWPHTGEHAQSGFCFRRVCYSPGHSA